ncbi:Methyltransferase domain-containing protein [Phyllobacterium sp. CL33Tsu]|uniref:50S ribosomal protein L11 methyltransferase n=1 Tax=Phyllobacterium sp. CL33Tsu TaxID=1798191 RepID=UPI0008E750BD|nr:class I SAM-dependent methyltransferase [Phyllobacterium sp. CL33Tsu]SFJ55490.1 Methyltransferase domain-containing protein [Phyllobacterium sp. CL33Tsu]
MEQIAGSFRDPSGHVFSHNDQIFRTVQATAKASYEKFRDSPVVKLLAEQGNLIGFDEVPHNNWPENIPSAEYVLRHPKIPYISYAYEWTFSQLKAAALCHLAVQLELFDEGFVLTDASAYNVQFQGPDPIFIDLLSIRPYRDGEFWLGHRQFCEQFLNPLLLRSLTGVSHNNWFRGALEGISTADIAKLIPIAKRLSFNVLLHVMMQARLERKSVSDPAAAVSSVKNRHTLKKSNYRALLQQMHNWISKLQPAGEKQTVWGEYAKENTYTGDEAQLKARLISEFTNRLKPRLLVDIGCNSGDYSVAALNGGAEYVVGFDFDQNALELAFARAQADQLQFLPLWLDASNPSPSQGWQQSERLGFDQRTKADALIALAFEHHLAIAKNVPLDQVVRWLTAIAPRGVIEFVPKDDPTVKRMLALREDIFPNYSMEEFAGHLSKFGRIDRTETISTSGRTLFFFEKENK